MPPGQTSRTVFVVPHTHWDREWYAPFQTFRAQLVDLWDALLALTETDPDFRFLMDGQTVVIDDYLTIKPESRPRLERAIREGRIEVGPWYTLPDGFLVSGETLVRNLQRGLSIAEASGGSLEAGYLPDSFGHPAQMPQIYRQFGFDHAVVWRGVPLAVDRLAFNWGAPDGSEILTAYMGTSYSHGVDLPTDPAALARRIDAALTALAVFDPGPDILLMNGNDHVLPQQHLSGAIRDANRYLGDARVTLAGMGEYLRTLRAGDWPQWRGELRSSARANVLMGTLSVRAPDKQRYFASTQLLERIAEPLAAFSGADVRGLLDEAWTLILHNAAHDTACGSGIDAVAAEARLRSDSANQIAAAIATRCLGRVAGEGQVWNPSAFPRQGLVEVEVDEAEVPPNAQPLPGSSSAETIRFRFPAGEVGRVHSVLDERRIAGERISGVDIRRDGSRVCVGVETRSTGASHDLERYRLEIERLASEPGVESIEIEVRRPAVGRVLVETPTIAGCSVATLAVPPRLIAPPVRAVADVLENAHLRCCLASDGTLTVEHKATRLTYAGLNRLLDEGDAGDEYNFSPPMSDRERPVRAAIEAPTIREAGPLRATLTTRFAYRVPAGLAPNHRGPVDAEVTLDVGLTVSLERDLARLDIALQVENRARDHRLRVHFPLPFAVAASHADTAYHVTGRPAATPRQDAGAPELELPTYPMRSFVDVTGEHGGLTLISHGLHEYEAIPGPPGALALTLLRAVGWLSRDDLRYRTGHAGPPMETPGAQVLGPHQFRYSLFFHEGGWEQAAVWRAAETALVPLVAGIEQAVDATPPSIELEPDCIQMTACVPRPDGYDLRLLNASDRAQEATVRLRPVPAEISPVTLRGQALTALPASDGLVRLSLRRWEIATLHVRRAAPSS
ncbi:MAG: hypothetical protein M3Z11_12505 [Candidatus Dormibacteraeota bacterium]|nr:hypothetical protein [Candidatus Dormibacteraeota bacterium]